MKPETRAAREARDERERQHPIARYNRRVEELGVTLRRQMSILVDLRDLEQQGVTAETQVALFRVSHEVEDVMKVAQTLRQMMQTRSEALDAEGARRGREEESTEEP
jgi:ABC-type thiamine transport system ATPase subunit